MTDHDDLEGVRRWFRALGECVEAVDFAAAHRLFAPDLVAFGTVADFVVGRDYAEREQWRLVWPAIDRFRWRLDGVRALVAPDRLMAVGLAVFDSTGYTPEGHPYDRPGRATVALARAAIGDDWIATHSHMSLFRGTPATSHGKREATG